MAPRWLSAPMLNALVDHRLRVHQMQVDEARFHSQIATVSAVYDAAQRTPAVRSYQLLLSRRRQQ